MKGLVIKNTGFWYTVLLDSLPLQSLQPMGKDSSLARAGERLIDCKVKGNFRLKGIRSTNPVAVGDRVKVEEGNWITDIEDRKNYIIRKASNLSKQSSIIAANVDQAMLIVTVNYPETSTTFIDRFLASAEAYRVPVILVFNKIDLYNEEELHYLEMMRSLYETIGYKTIAISAKSPSPSGLLETSKMQGWGEDLKAMLQGKITLFSGNSGVGKSTLINALVPGANQPTAEISDAHNQGTHTTTFSEMIRLPEENCSLPLREGAVCGNSSSPSDVIAPSLSGRAGGESSWIIDTPGVRGFGTFDIEPAELTSYFKEIFHFSKDCRFSDCTHTHEPGCAVLKAVENHYIALSRYNSYLSMLNDKDDGKYRAAY